MSVVFFCIASTRILSFGLLFVFHLPCFSSPLVILFVCAALRTLSSRLYFMLWCELFCLKPLQVWCSWGKWILNQFAYWFCQWEKWHQTAFCSNITAPNKHKTLSDINKEPWSGSCMMCTVYRSDTVSVSKAMLFLALTKKKKKS